MPSVSVIVTHLVVLILLVCYSRSDHSVSYVRTVVHIQDCENVLTVDSGNTTSQLKCSSWCSRIDDCKRYKFCPFTAENTGGECVLYGSAIQCLSTDKSNTCSCMVKKAVTNENGTSTCLAGYYGDNCENIVRDCAHAAEMPEYNVTGAMLMIIKPTLAKEPFEIYCKMLPSPLSLMSLRAYKTACNNQFNKSWAEYRDGFGSLEYGIWLGLEKVYMLSKEPGRNLGIQVVMKNSKSACMNQYTNFTISSESEDYRIHMGDLRVVANVISCSEGMRMAGLEVEGQPFATYDHYSGAYDCPNVRKGGWWFAEHSACTATNLNGVLSEGGVYWLPDFSTFALTYVEIDLLFL